METQFAMIRYGGGYTRSLYALWSGVMDRVGRAGLPKSWILICPSCARGER